MEIYNLQSSYEFRRKKCSQYVREYMYERYAYFESILPFVYGDEEFDKVELSDIYKDEFRDLVLWMAKAIARCEHSGSYFEKVQYDGKFHDNLQSYYLQLQDSVSNWTLRLIKSCRLYDVSSISPWLEGRYIRFARIHPKGSRVAVEMESIVSNLQIRLKLLHHERWSRSMVVDSHAVSSTQVLMQNKLDELIASLSGRARNLIICNGLGSIEVLEAWVNDSGRTFSNIQGCGIATSVELENMVEALSRYRFELENNGKEAISDTDGDDFLTIPELNNHTDNMLSHFEALFNTLSVRAQNVLQRNNLTNENDFREYTTLNKNDFTKLNWCGQHTALELRQMAQALIRSERKLGDSHLSGYDGKMMEKLQLMCDAFLASKSSNVRGVLGRRNMDMVDMIIPYIFDPSKQHPFGHLSKVGVIFDELIVKLRTFLLRSALYGHPVSTEEIPLSDANIYREDDISFIQQFHDENGRWPLFFIAQCFFRHTKNRGDIMLASLYGLHTNNVMFDVDVARMSSYQKGHLSRDALSRDLRSLISHKDWTNYTFLNSPCMLVNSKCVDADVNKIETAEHLTESASLMCIIARVFSHKVLCYDPLDLRFSHVVPQKDMLWLVISRDFEEFQFRKCLKDMLSLCTDKRNFPLVVDLFERYIYNEEYWVKSCNISSMLCKILADTLGRCFTAAFGVNCTSGKVSLPPNMFNFGEEIYLLLKSAGARLHISQICSALNSRLPKEKQQTIAQVAYYLKYDERIEPIGKSSYWDLKERNKMLGSIRMMAVAAVEASDEPVERGDLIDEIRTLRPECKAGSIRSIIGQCIKDGELSILPDGRIVSLGGNGQLTGNK